MPFLFDVPRGSRISSPGLPHPAEERGTDEGGEREGAPGFSCGHGNKCAPPDTSDPCWLDLYRGLVGV
jgi:hypothetical protein